MTNTSDKELSAYISFDEFDEVNYLRLGASDFESMVERTMTRGNIGSNKLPQYARFYAVSELNT